MDRTKKNKKIKPDTDRRKDAFLDNIDTTPR